jgi:hypothetical protein
MIGMLKNAKHERFAQGLAEGKSQAQAYTDAGYKAKQANAEASRLIQHVPDITQRRDEILQARRLDADSSRRYAVQQAGYDKARILTTLAEIVDRSMQYAPVTDEKGGQVFVPAPEGMTTKDGQPVLLCAAYTFDAKAATAALKLLGIEEGMFIPREERRPSPLDGLPADVLQAIAQKLRLPAPAGYRLDLPREPVTIDGTRSDVAGPSKPGTSGAGPSTD